MWLRVQNVVRLYALDGLVLLLIISVPWNRLFSGLLAASIHNPELVVHGIGYGSMWKDLLEIKQFLPAALVLLRDRGQFATLTIRPLGEPIPPSQGESPFPLDFYLSWMSPVAPGVSPIR